MQQEFVWNWRVDISFLPTIAWTAFFLSFITPDVNRNRFIIWFSIVSWRSKGKKNVIATCTEARQGIINYETRVHFNILIADFQCGFASALLIMPYCVYRILISLFL